MTTTDWSKILKNTGTTRGHIRTANLALYQLDHVRLILRISKTLAGKSLANQRSIRQIHRSFPPPTFRTIRYAVLLWFLVVLNSLIDTFFIPYLAFCE